MSDAEQAMRPRGADELEYLRCCPGCGLQMNEDRCKRRCPRCGYFESCADLLT